MSKPEYSDLYKFIVSLGLIIITYAFILPFWVFRESFDTNVRITEISKLTTTAQTIISYRQNTALWLTQNIIMISSILVIVGSAMIIAGFVYWKRKQNIIDKKDVLETEKLSLEIKRMSPEQILNKVIKEVTEDNQIEQEENMPILERTSQINAIKQYIETEKIVVEKLVTCFGKANVKPNIKIGDKEIDVLVRMSPQERAIFEVKHFNKPVDITRRQRDIVDALEFVVEKYCKYNTHLHALGIGLLIIGNDYTDKLEQNYFDRIVVQVIKNKTIKVITLTENELGEIKCDEFRKLLTINNYLNNSSETSID